ncbi:MAG TPA: hypothetical protein VLM18_08130 [Croceibacterium sp.]|nr:hypothetical protein [Croceibacterium sp.]
MLAVPVPASAGPPFLTDDPEPTEVGHWEIYAPLFEADGSGNEFAGALETEINYDAASDLQLTLGVPAAYTHDARGWRGGGGRSRSLGEIRLLSRRRSRNADRRLPRRDIADREPRDGGRARHGVAVRLGAKGHGPVVGGRCSAAAAMRSIRVQAIAITGPAALR